ncbi:MAG: NAD(P)H-binding protein [Pseudomonadota bacterium]
MTYAGAMDGLDGPVVLLGATGTIGRAVAAALRARGVAVRAPGRDGGRGAADYAGARAVVSCMASRSGVAADAWAVDYRAHLAALDAAKAAQVPRFLQLSAICLQKPRLTFQHAKLAFEAELRASGLSWTIVRPTAYFKSLSGQVPRVLGGKPFLVFGDGEMTATKPISDRDLAAYLVDCLADPATARCVLPVGGPGPAVTPRAQGEMIFCRRGADAAVSSRFAAPAPHDCPRDGHDWNRGAASGAQGRAGADWRLLRHREHAGLGRRA